MSRWIKYEQPKKTKIKIFALHCIKAPRQETASGNESTVLVSRTDNYCI